MSISMLKGGKSYLPCETAESGFWDSRSGFALAPFALIPVTADLFDTAAV